MSEICRLCGSDSWATDEVGKWRCAECGILSPAMYGKDESERDARWMQAVASLTVPDEFDDDETCDYDDEVIT